ncbi:MAG: tRNA epoxyqueuosine(34) reductase QueG [Bacteroidia bacterium]|nr:tRNA epoxyqueuosine(34) reductase QueG [Bacteroidia bacterium]
MTTSADKTLSLLIKENAYEHGFDLCGIVLSKSFKEHEPIIRNWCSSGMNGDMDYLGQYIEKRINPGLLIPGAKSVIVTGLNYYTEKKQGGNGIPVISRYAYGINYHNVIKGKLNKILDYIKSINPEVVGKSFVDSAPIIEKAWAREAGLGWPGRHSILINNKIGSFFFLGVIVLNIDLDCDKPYTEDHCGTCTLCIDSCPTGAINENRTIDVRKCIAYLTIENKGPVPEELARKMEGRVFGCDKCQEVCPWNKIAKPHKNPEFELPEEIKQMTAEEWHNLTREQFNRLFKRSAIERRTYERFMQNVTIVTKFSS